MVKHSSLKYIFVIVCVSYSNCIIGQKDADEKFVKSNFDDAYNLYSTYPLEKLTPEQVYRMAVSVLNGSTYSKIQAIELLEKYLENNSTDGNARYLYGRALAFEQRFDEAEKQFTFCLTSTN